MGGALIVMAAENHSTDAKWELVRGQARKPAEDAGLKIYCLRWAENSGLGRVGL